MKSLFSFKRGKESKRVFFWILIGVAFLTLLLVEGILPLIDEMKKTQEEISIKKMTLERYVKVLQNRKVVEEELDRAQKQHEALQKRLLLGETPQLASAHLQEVVKKILERNGMTLRSFRILEPKETPSYQKISIHIDFNPVNNLLSLIQFIHEIETHEKELMISEMDLIVPNVRNPNQIQGSFVITGLMKKGETKPKEKGG